MPLLDHFHPPLSRHRPWEGVHSAWANTLARLLNEELLPDGYYAMPNVQLHGQMEVDVATLEEADHHAAGSATATAVWAPPRPALAIPIDFADLDVFEVQIRHDEQGPRLLGAIELVSPANKDRPSHRHAFVIKCASYLQQGIAVMVIDVVTSRAGNLHVQLFDLLKLARHAAISPPDLYATAYRTNRTAEQSGLEVWEESLRVGAELPTLPLWLHNDCVVPVDFERSYQITCESLRIQA